MKIDLNGHSLTKNRVKHGKLGFPPRIEENGAFQRNGSLGKSAIPLRVGLFGIGNEAYWPQFKGLKNRLEHYIRTVKQRLARPGLEVVWGW
jgi:hypothetical protein